MLWHDLAIIELFLLLFANKENVLKNLDFELQIERLENKFEQKLEEIENKFPAIGKFELWIEKGVEKLKTKLKFRKTKNNDEYG